MSLKRGFRFLALMLFISVVVIFLARSSILELRRKAEEGFTQQRLAALRQVVRRPSSPPIPLYMLTREGAINPLAHAQPLSAEQKSQLISLIPTHPGSLRQGDIFWVSLPLAEGGCLLSSAPYREVIAWTSGFERREIRNAMLVIAAFGFLAMIWMWADRRALLAAQKAKMVEELERLVRERTEALQRMDRLAKLGEFAASLAHEIRNPLSSLVTAARLLPDSSEEEQAELIGVIRQESRRLDRLLAELLDFSKDPQPRIRLAPLHPILRQAMERLKRDPACAGVRIQYRLDPEIKEVPCDPEQLERAFWNIALNGAQAMGGEGELVVSTSRNGRWAEVSIQDAGPGIPLEKQERIFQPLYTEKDGGTGLGLSIASRIVQAHGGFIQVVSDAHSWTRFTISLPLQEQG